MNNSTFFLRVTWECHIQLYALDGRILKNFEAHALPAQVDFKDLPKSMYFLKLETAEGVVSMVILVE